MRFVILLAALASAALGAQADFFSAPLWTSIHCDVAAAPRGALRVTFWKGYEDTGIETTRLPLADWSRFRSFRFEVDNPYSEPFSVFVRLSDRADHPRDATYTGGTFDGYVIGPGRRTVEVSLADMRSPGGQAVDPARIAWMGVFFQPLFLRDGMELKFRADATFVLSNARLSPDPAAVQMQPYGDLLFPPGTPQPPELRAALDELAKTMAIARERGIETRYAAIYPFLARMAFQSRLVAFWQDAAAERRRALDFLLTGARQADRELRRAIETNDRRRTVPPVPGYGSLAIRDGYFRLAGNPVLLFGMLYNQSGPLLDWFADSQTDFGTELVAGGTRHDVEKQPIWQAYQQYPDTHRVGWPHADHIIRDSSSWEVLGPPVSVCLESPHSREAVARMIENYEQTHAGQAGRRLVQTMGFEYTYVCYCDYTRRMWAGWLQAKYGQPAAANRVWGTRFDSFAAVPMPHPEQAAANRALWFDWSSFNLYRFLEQIRWTRDQIRRWNPNVPLTVGSPYFAFDPAFWTGVDEEELADSGITQVVLEENYRLDSLMPEYLHALANEKPVADFEYHGVISHILPSFLHGDAAISMWWWNQGKHWTPNEPINEWASSFPQSYTIPLSDAAKAMRDALDVRRLGREIAALAGAPRPIVLLYSKTSMLQQVPAESGDTGTFPFLAELRRLYNASQSIGLYVGLTTEKKILAGDLGRRKVLVVPGAEYVDGRVPAEILKWVESGGTLIVSPDSLLADEYARPSGVPAALGLRLLRREPPVLKRGEKVVTEYNLSDLPRAPFRMGDAVFETAGGRQALDAPPAEVAARFPDRLPALVRIPRGRGVVYWLASPLAAGSWRRFLSRVAEEAGLKPELRVWPPVEWRTATLAGRRLAYLFNDSGEDLTVTMNPAFACTGIVDLREESALAGRTLRLPAGETALLEFR